SYPLDYSHKRQARTTYAGQALRVTEAQYQDEVRRGLGGLAGAYVDVLAARRTVQYARVNAQGLAEVLRGTAAQLEGTATSADVEQARSESAISSVSLLDAEESLRQRQRTLSELLNLPPEQAEQLELRGTLEDRDPPPPPPEELIRAA